MQPAESPNIYTRFETFYGQFFDESDRGAALVAAAYLDELLVPLFRARMLQEKTSEELLQGFAPLSTFAARIKVAYCLGWIGPETYDDLNTLKKIRNKFAHAHEPMTFNDAAIQTLCANLRIAKAKLPENTAARVKFLSAVASIAIRLEFYRDASAVITATFDPPVPVEVRSE